MYRTGVFSLCCRTLGIQSLILQGINRGVEIYLPSLNPLLTPAKPSLLAFYKELLADFFAFL